MATKRLKRPTDLIQRGKLIGDILTGQVEDRQPDTGNAAAAEMGSKGGKARAAKLTSEKRSEIAKRAAAIRWKST